MIAATLHCITKGVEIELHVEPGSSLIQFARNRLAQDFLNDKSYTHILWIDSDIAFQPDAVMQLLDHGVDVCGGSYPVKQIPVWFPSVSLDGEDRTKLHRAEVLPTGFLLVSRKAMEAVAATVGTYIHHHNNQEKPTKHIFELELVGDGDVKQLLGEDVVFGHRLRAIGFDLWLDPGLTFLHWGPFTWRGCLREMVEQEAAGMINDLPAHVGPPPVPMPIPNAGGLAPVVQLKRTQLGDAITKVVNGGAACP